MYRIDRLIESIEDWDKELDLDEYSSADLINPNSHSFGGNALHVACLYRNAEKFSQLFESIDTEERFYALTLRDDDGEIAIESIYQLELEEMVKFFDELDGDARHYLLLQNYLWEILIIRAPQHFIDHILSDEYCLDSENRQKFVDRLKIITEYLPTLFSDDALLDEKALELCIQYPNVAFYLLFRDYADDEVVLERALDSRTQLGKIFWGNPCGDGCFFEGWRVQYLHPIQEHLASLRQKLKSGVETPVASSMSAVSSPEVITDEGDVETPIALQMSSVSSQQSSTSEVLNELSQSTAFQTDAPLELSYVDSRGSMDYSESILDLDARGREVFTPVGDFDSHCLATTRTMVTPTPQRLSAVG